MAGTMASSSGSASAVPDAAQKRAARRAFFVTIIAISSFETACC